MQLISSIVSLAFKGLGGHILVQCWDLPASVSGLSGALLGGMLLLKFVSEFSWSCVPHNQVRRRRRILAFASLAAAADACCSIVGVKFGMLS